MKLYLNDEKTPVDPPHHNDILWVCASYVSGNTVQFFTKNVTKVKNLMLKTHWNFCIRVAAGEWRLLEKFVATYRI